MKILVILTPKGEIRCIPRDGNHRIDLKKKRYEVLFHVNKPWNYHYVSILNRYLSKTKG